MYDPQGSQRTGTNQPFGLTAFSPEPSPNKDGSAEKQADVSDTMTIRHGRVPKLNAATRRLEQKQYLPDQTTPDSPLLSTYAAVIPLRAGGHGEKATPVPIPNTAVKVLCGNGTALKSAGE